MKKSLLKTISFCVIFLTSNNLLSQANNWEEHFINDTVKIEFSYQKNIFMSKIKFFKSKLDFS